VWFVLRAELLYLIYTSKPQDTKKKRETHVFTGHDITKYSDSITRFTSHAAQPHPSQQAPSHLPFGRPPDVVAWLCCVFLGFLLLAFSGARVPCVFMLIGYLHHPLWTHAPAPAPTRPCPRLSRLNPARQTMFRRAEKRM